MFQVESYLIFKKGNFVKNNLGVFKSKKLARVKICSEIQALRDVYNNSIEVTSSDNVYSVFLILTLPSGLSLQSRS